jgi:hypothetical protein
MFRQTSTQRLLFGVETGMDPAKRARLERSWAHAFRNAALPLIDEQRLAKYFDPGNGRPNKSVRLVLSVLVLKEVFDLTDAEALEQLEWNAAWHHALEVEPEKAHTCQKTLHNYRALLLKDEQGAGLFESTTARLIEAAGLRTSRQRQDSTHIVSNIKMLTRLGLFTKTVTQFLEALRKRHPRLIEQVPKELRERYLDREGYFADARSSEAPRRLEQTALDVHELVLRFCDHRVISQMESFGLLRRLYKEQCVAPTQQSPERIQLQEKPESTSLQSPSDPDVTYGHKGKGFEVQLAETCEQENPFQVVTAVELTGAHQSDQHQVEPMLEQAERVCGAAPEKMHADCGFGSGENLLLAQQRGTQLLAPIGPSGSEKGLSLRDFAVDAQSGTILQCPVGQVPTEHRTGSGRVKLALLDLPTCAVCPVRSLCPMTMRKGQPVVAFTAAELAVVQRREEQETPEFKEQHKIRSGIEATNSELKRSHGLGKPRVRSKPRVALAVRLKVLGLNLKRYVIYLSELAAGRIAAPACAC